jgi:hypothetical protein
MAARKDKSNTAGQFQKGDPRTQSDASKGGTEKARKMREEIMPLRELALDMFGSDEKMREWISQLCKLWEEKGDLQAFKLLLQILGIMPKEEKTIDVKMEGLSDEDRALINAVRARYESR